MKINERLYPHPVQSYFSDDLQDCSFQVTQRIHAARQTYKVQVMARTSSSDLRSLVAEGHAIYAVHIECAATRYRRLITSADEEFFEEIPADLLDGRVEVCSLIVASKDIPEYKNSNFHVDYGDTSFFVKKGDVLAVGNDIHFDATKDIDPLQNVASIFKVRPNLSATNESLMVDLQDHCVVILLSQKNFDFFSQLRVDQDRQTLLASMIVVPALVFVLEEIKSAATSGDIDEFNDRRWFKVIAKKVKQLGLDPERLDTWASETSLVLAQKLVGDPLSSSLKSMADLEDDGAGD
jgi:hypothetical protein